MKIAIGADHGGYALKKYLINYLAKCGHKVMDAGTYSPESCDYPEFAKRTALLVVSKKADRGIVICKSGIGTTIVPNKFKGIRAALCMNTKMARLSREHNDANVLALGVLFVKPDLAKRIVSVFLKTRFSGGRHKRRVNQIKSIEREICNGVTG